MVSCPSTSGHIGITVDDTYKACERFERLGVEFVKKPDDGNKLLNSYSFSWFLDIYLNIMSEIQILQTCITLDDLCSSPRSGYTIQLAGSHKFFVFCLTIHFGSCFCSYISLYFPSL